MPPRRAAKPSVRGREILGEKLLHGGELDGRTIEIADETRSCGGHGQRPTMCCSRTASSARYADDVTQSAPVNTPRE